MANAHYAKGKEKTLRALINWETATVKAALVRNDYPQNLATDEFYSTISTYVVGTPQTLANKTVTNGIFDADDVTFPTVAAGSTCEGVVLYVDTGNPATSPLLSYVDSIVGFPLVTTGGDALVQWDNGAYKIFSI